MRSSQYPDFYRPGVGFCLFCFVLFCWIDLQNSYGGSEGMFRRPKVPNDKNKKQPVLTFVFLLIPAFTDFPHVVLLLRKSLGEIKDL